MTGMHGNEADRRLLTAIKAALSERYAGRPVGEDVLDRRARQELALGVGPGDIRAATQRRAPKRTHGRPSVEELQRKLNPPKPRTSKRLWTTPVYPGDVDWRDPNDRYMTRLHKAAISGDLSMVRHLVEVEGAEVMVGDCRTRTAIHLAGRAGHDGVAEYLVAHRRGQLERWLARQPSEIRKRYRRHLDALA